jgi:hypothetical protein
VHWGVLVHSGQKIDEECFDSRKETIQCLCLDIAWLLFVLHGVHAWQSSCVMLWNARNTNEIGKSQSEMCKTQVAIRDVWNTSRNQRRVKHKSQSETCEIQVAIRDVWNTSRNQRRVKQKSQSETCEIRVAIRDVWNTSRNQRCVKYNCPQIQAC